MTIVGRVESFVKTKAFNDFYGDVHYREEDSGDSTLCGLKIAKQPTER